MRIIEKIRHNISRAVGVFATLVMGTMITLAFSQLIARWVFNTSIAGADLMLRQMVLIIGLLGGVLAAVSDRHIRIDLFDNFLKGKLKINVRRFVNITASIVAGDLAWASIFFVQSEREANVVLRGLFFGQTVPQWYIEILIPICFFLMALLFLSSGISRTISSDISGNK